MENAVYHDAVEFILEGGFVVTGVRTDAVDGDENVAADQVRSGRVVERDDVGIVIVLQVLLVHLAQVAIAAENVIDLRDPMVFRFSGLLDPLAQVVGAPEDEAHIFFEEQDGG